MILARHHEGQSVRAITQAVKVSNGTVHAVITAGDPTASDTSFVPVLLSESPADAGDPFTGRVRLEPGHGRLAGDLGSWFCRLVC
jgi:hypothetical protein